MPARHPDTRHRPPAPRPRIGTALTFVGALLLALACQTAAAAAPAVPATQPTAAHSLTLRQLHQRAAELGIARVKKMKVKGPLVEIKGYDAQHHKVKVTLDGRSGELLYRHGPAGRDGTPAGHAAVKMLSLPQLEQRALAQGVQVKEMEVKGLLLEVEGYDRTHREVEMTLDRRTGKVLYRGFDD